MGATAGQSFGPSQNVEIEYIDVIRPVGSNVPAGNITIYVLEMGPVAQKEIAALLGPSADMPPARPCLRVGQWRRMLRQAGTVSTPALSTVSPAP
jgi:hypothetical protein